MRQGEAATGPVAGRTSTDVAPAISAIARREIQIAMSEIVDRLTEAKLLAELWIRSPDPNTRRMGADLKQVLGEDH